MKIELKHKIPLIGEYNGGVYRCPECREELWTDNSNGSVFDNTIGFADSRMGLMMIVECPKCFTKWYYHNGLDEEICGYHYFLLSIKFGRQKHFDS